MDSLEDALRDLDDALDAEARRASDRIDGAALRRRARRRAGRPLRELVSTVALMVVGFAWGFVSPVGWMMALGLAFAVLPDKLRARRDPGPDVERLGEADLLTFVNDELMLKFAGTMWSSFGDVLIVALFGVMAIFLPDPRPALIVAGLFIAHAAYLWIWRIPRLARKLPDDDEDDDE